MSTRAPTLTRLFLVVILVSPERADSLEDSGKDFSEAFAALPADSGDEAVSYISKPHYKLSDPEHLFIYHRNCSPTTFSFIPSRNNIQIACQF